MRTTVQGPDVYYQSQEANNGAYDSIPAVVEGYMQGINEITGRDYHIFNYYGAKDADRVMVMKNGISSTWIGIMVVDSMPAMTTLRPRYGSRAIA